MAGLYPNLQERFKTEGVCPICLYEMEFGAKYSCSNGHTICHRCQPHYHLCPTCGFSLMLEPPDNKFVYPNYLTMPVPVNDRPSAPPIMQDFLNHEKRYPQLFSCTYAHHGCWIKFPGHLKDLHESRCQFRPHLEENELPTDLNSHENDLVDCSYRSFGCQKKIVPWRKHIHENHCSYKNRSSESSDDFQSWEEKELPTDLNSHENDLVDCSYRSFGCQKKIVLCRKHIHENHCSYKNRSSELSDDFQSWTIVDDSKELIDCDYKIYGCRVRMPRNRKYNHQEICNYKNHHNVIPDQGYSMSASSHCGLDPEQSVECKWSEYGCRVKPQRARKEIHEGICNYKMLECAYKDYGCHEVFHPSRKYAHESRCHFAS